MHAISYSINNMIVQLASVRYIIAKGSCLYTAVLQARHAYAMIEHNIYGHGLHQLQLLEYKNLCIHEVDYNDSTLHPLSAININGAACYPIHLDLPM